MERWPNFFIVGAPKAGTTSLYEYLRTIPGIYMSPIKEPHYFSIESIPAKFPMNPIRDKKKYISLFENATNEKIIGESSATYLFDYKAAQLIHKVSPDAKILISLRDPVERAFSQYLMIKRGRQLETSFKNAIKSGLEHGIIGGRINEITAKYYESINRYLQLFGKKQVKIIIFEEWVKNPTNIIEEILEFLELNYKIEESISGVHNRYYTWRSSVIQQLRTNRKLRPIVQNVVPSSFRKYFRKKFLIKTTLKPEMRPEDRELLKKLYWEDVQKIEKFLGRKLLWPNFQN